MSERRQLALLLVGLVVLALVGFLGAALFPEGCEDLEQVGELELVLTDAVDALPLSDEEGQAVQQVAEALGIGSWRGAVALPDGAVVTPSEFGFFVVTDTAFTVLRPSFGISSAARGRTGLDVISAGTSLALRAADGETGVVNGEYELARCGQLPTGTEVLALDRGFAVTAVGSDVALVTLSGDEVWQASATAAHLTGDTVVLGADGVLELRDVREGEVLDVLTDVPEPGPIPRPGPTPWTDAVEQRMLLPAPGGVVPVTVGTAALDVGPPIDLPLDPDPVGAAVLTPAGIVASGRTGEGIQGSALATDRRGTPVVLPSGVRVVALHASADGHVGVLVEVEGSRALLVYGRDVVE